MVDVVGEEDRISDLPDAILVNILSLLPTKSAFCTSILSKRWRYVWTCIPIVDFRKLGSPRPLSNEGYSTTRNAMFADKVMNFLDRMLFLHEMPNLKKFCLKTNHHFDSFRVNAWLIILIRRKIEELILDISLLTPFAFPLCLFTSESLIKLELQMYWFDVLNLPESICFPKLKILWLTDVSFVDANLTQQLFSNCPILEELSLTDCSCADMNFVCISVPTLKSLFIHCGAKYCFDTSVLKIYAPNLVSLRYIGLLPLDYVLDSFPSLVDADIQFMRIEETSNVSFKLFEKLSNVELLKMSEFTTQALSLADDPIMNLPSFCNLIRLEVNWRTYNIETLFEFLHISPNLESLVFIEGSCHDKYDDHDDLFDWAPNLVPQCVLLHLKSVELRDFTAYPEELGMVKLFLKISGVLQTMSIKASYALIQDLKGTTEDMVLMKRLLMFPKASASCVIRFSSPGNS